MARMLPKRGLWQKEVREIHLPHDISHCRLGQLGNGVVKILHLQDRFVSLPDFVIDNGINADRNIVFGYCFLVGNVHCFHPQIHFFVKLDDRPDQSPARIHQTRIPAESEFQSPFVLGNLLD